MGIRHWASPRPFPDDALIAVAGGTPSGASLLPGPPGGYPDRTHTGKRRRADDTRSTTYTVNVRTRKSCERAWQIAGVDSSRADAGDCPEWVSREPEVVLPRRGGRRGWRSRAGTVPELAR